MKINLIEYFEDTVLRTPEKIAIKDGSREISFFELQKRAQVIATHIIKVTQCCINKPIAVYLKKSIEAIYSDIGITYSGNCYMNLDINTPEARIANIIERVNPVLIISDSETSKKLEFLSDSAIILIIDEIKNDEIDQRSINKQVNRIIDLDPLCIINTSGSTGTPKGAVLNHKSYIDYTQWAIDTFRFDGSEILGVLSPIIFDHYNYEISLMMTKGSCLVLLDNSLAAFPAKLLEVLLINHVNYIFWVPTIMVNIANLNLFSNFSLPEIKIVWFAGEVFPTKQFNYWRKHLPNAKFVNLYGPVETTVDCTYYVVERELKDEEPIPIGFACRNTDIIILNANNEIVKGSEPGELCVRGTSLAMGYYNNSEKTRDVFVQNPLNQHFIELIYRTGDIVFKNDLGEIIFKGRKDSLIKHLGYRIELGEIEHVIVNSLKIVDNACVVYQHKRKEIVVLYESSMELSVIEFRKALLNVLPKYMVPTVFKRVEILPRNINGKIDRFQLTEKENND